MQQATGRRGKSKGPRQRGRVLPWALTAAMMLLAAGCNDGGKPTGGPNSAQDPQASKGDTTMTIGITSSAFEQGQPIPQRYSGEGQNISPPLSWDNVPSKAKTLVLTMEDPDAPSGTFIHWVLYDLPAQTSGLAENVPHQATVSNLEGAKQGPNSAGKIGYTGPKPPIGHGRHRYFFRIHALDAALNIAPGATAEQLRQAMAGHVIAEGELMGTYERK